MVGVTIQSKASKKNCNCQSMGL